MTTKSQKNNLFPCLILMMAAYSTGGESSIDLPHESYDLLFIGNSHSASNGLPELVTTLIEAGVPGTTACSALAPGYHFLAERLNDGVTQQVLISRPWTHVILQAQKYSSSGLYTYPTEAAEEWIRRITTLNAKPVLFPEWPRKGNTEEGPRIHQLHLEISSRESACVAPVGLAWEESIARYPGLNLHAADGNHSNLTGALLTAYVFYQIFTGQPAAGLPYVQGIGVSADIQQKLREVASTVVESNQANCSEVEVISEVEIISDTAVPALSYWGLFTLALLVLGMSSSFLRK